MLAKLAVRNVKRSARDYRVYFLTMTFVTALMFAFHTILFSKDVQKMFEMAMIMSIMIGVATFFIVLIIAWLINYMVKFILEKRSREFGVYLLLGMKKTKIARLYMCENLLLGTGAFFSGLLLGLLLQQIMLSVLYGMLQMNYKIHLEFRGDCLLMTAACFAGCYLLALVRCRRRFKRMNIYDLMNAQKQNEEVRENAEQVKKWILPLSILFLLAFGGWLLCGNNWDIGAILLFVIGLVLVIYCFYTGLASWIVCYIRKKGKGIYRGQRLFLLRQFSAKIRTMRFTMGTLTALFTLALLGCSIAMMFNNFQNQILGQKFPFDVQIYSADVQEDFHKELALLEEKTSMKENYAYHIYQDGTNQVNTWLYTHLQTFGETYRGEDGTPDRKKIEQNESRVYCDYDTYMGITDYNHLRKMLGLEEIKLEKNQYTVHIKERILRETGDFSEYIRIKGTDGYLKLEGYHTEPFSQDGHNGGDYILIVPDEVVKAMQPYYSELVADIQGKAPEGLQKRLDALKDNTADPEYEWLGESNCSGSDTIVTYCDNNLVRDNAIPEIKYILSAIIFPMFYMGLVFLCVALTVLSVQQLSDSAKYRFRYGVLRKIGLSRKEVLKIIRRQLFGYYICPALFASLISGIIMVYTGERFNFYTGIKDSMFRYFGISFVLFFGIYALYFIVTYIGFKRNVEDEVF